MKIRIVNYLFLILVTLLLFSCKKNNGDTETIYANSYYNLTLSNLNGAIKSIEKNGRQMIDIDNAKRALFEICFRDTAKKGEVVRINSDFAGKCEINQSEDRITISFSQFEDIDLFAIVTVDVSKDSPFMNWNIIVDNNSPYLMDYIDFPNVVVPNDLIGNGGDSRIFWPAQEGVVIEDINIREEGIRKYQPIEYPNLLGWIGMYPSSAQTQFMAYYSSQGGLYMATHDDQCHPKGIEYCKTGRNGIKMEYHLFTTGAGKGKHKLPYNMVIGTFEGDWYDAADIYRNWVESSKISYPKKISENENLPLWYFESPVVVTYPIRGQKDMGDMTLNELYPYTNALPIIDKLGKAFDSKILSLLMHWEGSAPWAPPYAWPPYGSITNFNQFVENLHDNGNYIGLYASGIGYTLRSNTDTTFNKYDEFEKLGLEKIMKKAPDGGFSSNNVCAAPHAQRLGYDMCPTNRFVKDVVVSQVSQMVSEGNVDYIQYFDQNLGGACYGCYSNNHGHGYGPGTWQNEAMEDIYKTLMPILNSSKRRPLLGCEAAAAEPFYQYLLFNDNRSTINLGFGTPVPAYQYINHEYINGFMGNQNSLGSTINIAKSPLNMLQRLAYSFTAGDMFTVILRGNGDMIQAWGALWEEKIPDQDHMKTLIKNLNAWRLHNGKDFLVTGRMLKPLPFEGAYNIPMVSKSNGLPINFPSVLTSNWQSQDKRYGQIFVNYLPDQQEIAIDMKKMKDIWIMHNATEKAIQANASKLLKIAVDPLSAVMVLYSN
ncbi:DUF6259 domain-containing protein [Sunxiuqinia sp. A32]|uniref:DUF6259 domain-containing protein n=1 Tax=Sunxiuqinia sp. A32 TaxID=3461496 RepID=UPI0040460C5E